MSRYTALLIISWGDCIKCYGGGKDNKWAGFIYLEEPRSEDYIRPRCLLSTEPIYLTEEDAVNAMKALIEDVRAHEKEILGNAGMG